MSFEGPKMDKDGVEWNKDVGAYQHAESDGITVFTSGEHIPEELWDKAIAIAKERNHKSIAIKMGWDQEKETLHISTPTGEYIDQISIPNPPQN